MFDNVIVTCEHAGNKIPEAYLHLFKGATEMLQSHRGWDPGALELATFLSKSVNAPLFYAENSRLLIETNRSIGTHDHFSVYTRSLPDDEKQAIIEEYYMPYRREVQAFLEHLIYSDKRVLHLSVHTFTPELNNEIRDADIGLLFDPAREIESDLCIEWQKIAGEDSNFKMKLNYPYAGTDDGFTTHLRSVFPADQYAGIEIEVNQKFPLNDGEPWNSIKQFVLKTFTQTLAKLSQKISG